MNGAGLLPWEWKLPRHTDKPARSAGRLTFAQRHTYNVPHNLVHQER